MRRHILISGLWKQRMPCRRTLFRRCVISKEIYSNLPSCYKRGACPVVKCNLPEFQLTDMISVHDLKDYGDCDEEIYRQLFLDGCYRLEINIPGENGILSKKIYYLKPEPPKNSIELIPISYQDFLKWKL